MKTVLGIDGGLAHLGWAVAIVPADGAPTVIDGGVIETERRSEGTAAESHTERALELHEQLDAIVEKHRPREVCAESFSPPRDARNASMLAWSWGVICAIAARHGLALRQKGPMPLKRAFTGNQAAKKNEMIEAALERYPEARGLFGIRRDLHEHLADAIAAIHYFHASNRHR